MQSNVCVHAPADSRRGSSTSATGAQGKCDGSPGQVRGVHLTCPCEPWGVETDTLPTGKGVCFDTAQWGGCLFRHRTAHKARRRSRPTTSCRGGCRGLAEPSFGASARPWRLTVAGAPLSNRLKMAGGAPRWHPYVCMLYPAMYVCAPVIHALRGRPSTRSEGGGR